MLVDIAASRAPGVARRDLPASMLIGSRAARQSRRRNRSAASTASRSSRRVRPAPPPRNRRSGRNLRCGDGMAQAYRVNSMTTLMSPCRCSSASLQRSSGTRRVIKRASQPLSARASASRRHLVMAAVGVDGAEHAVIVEHHRAVDRGRCRARISCPGRRDAGQADDAGRTRSHRGNRGSRQARRCIP